MGVVLRPHPVCGESHIQLNADGEVATPDTRIFFRRCWSPTCKFRIETFNDRPMHYIKKYERQRVVPVAHLCLFGFLHFDIQSTGKKSHCAHTRWRPSWCCALINQPPGHWPAHAHPPLGRTSSKLPVRRWPKRTRGRPRAEANTGPWANPLPDVTDLVCRPPTHLHCSTGRSLLSPSQICWKCSWLLLSHCLKPDARFGHCLKPNARFVKKLRRNPSYPRRFVSQRRFFLFHNNCVFVSQQKFSHFIYTSGPPLAAWFPQQQAHLHEAKHRSSVLLISFFMTENGNQHPCLTEKCLISRTSDESNCDQDTNTRLHSGWKINTLVHDTWRLR